METKGSLVIVHETTPQQGGLQPGPTGARVCHLPRQIRPCPPLPPPHTNTLCGLSGWPSFLQATRVLASLEGCGPWGSQPAPWPGAGDPQPGECRRVK